MGTYTALSIAGYSIIDTKSEVIPVVMTVFRETDRRVYTKCIDDETETAFEYSCETQKVIDRLNVMGFTLKRAEEDFERDRKAKLEELESWAETDSDATWFGDEWEFIKKLTFDAYASSFSKVISDGLCSYRKKEGLDPVTEYILKDHDLYDGYLFGFFTSDIRLLLRLACEVVPAESQVVQDITELVSNGYYEEQEPVCENAIQRLVAGHPENSPRIILTEGRTDAKILHESLELLYPHLSAYYTFFDFNSSRPPGGAGNLVSLVKAFSAAGITNRIIAMFDNDTAAHDARRALKNISLSPNIIVMVYPELELLRTYPTLGPGGHSPLDVNGLAASIELYLGEDVLKSRGGKLTPVQWKGYCQKLKQYHGEVIDKARLQKRFNQKIKRCMADREAISATDWSGISAILQSIFHAFE